jgi:hypothetical protein
MDNPPTTPVEPADTRTMPLEKRIARQAYTLWEGYGRPAERDLDIWLEAERQVLGVDASVNQQGFGSVSAPRLRTAHTPQAPRVSTPDGGVVSTTKTAPASRNGR